jgi:hypothetical protein
MEIPQIADKQAELLMHLAANWGDTSHRPQYLILWSFLPNVDIDTAKFGMDSIQTALTNAEWSENDGLLRVADDWTARAVAEAGALLRLQARNALAVSA